MHAKLRDLKARICYRENGLVFLETSAKTAHNVEEAFNDTARAILAKIDQGAINVSNEVHGVKVGYYPGAGGNSTVNPGQAGANRSQGGCC